MPVQTDSHTSVTVCSSIATNIMAEAMKKGAGGQVYYLHNRVEQHRGLCRPCEPDGAGARIMSHGGVDGGGSIFCKGKKFRCVCSMSIRAPMPISFTPCGWHCPSEYGDRGDTRHERNIEKSPCAEN